MSRPAQRSREKAVEALTAAVLCAARPLLEFETLADREEKVRQLIAEGVDELELAFERGAQEQAEDA